MISDNRELFSGNDKDKSDQLLYLFYEKICKFLSNFWKFSDVYIFLWSEEPDVSPRRPISKKNTLKQFASLLE